MIVCAVPVKDLANAKQRLVPALGPTERRDLARAMLRDVLAALAAARLDRVWVITRDAEVARMAAGAGAEALTSLTEAENASHTTAVAFAQAEAARRRARVFLTIPGDVPCVTAAEIRALTAAVRDGAPALASSRSGLGTNGVALAPPDAMPLTFGEPSFENHLAAARRLGLTPRILVLPGLGLDVDAPEDLAALRAEGPATESARLVREWSSVGAGSARPTRPWEA
jgi:2-phospho-L-lactate guanylyltransferase